MYKNSKNLSNKFSNFLFSIGIIISTLFTLYCIFKVFNPSSFVTLKFYFISIFFGICSINFFIFGLLKFGDETKINLSITIITIGIFVYAVEFYLSIPKEIDFEKIAKDMGIYYDKRTELEFINELEKSGIEVFPRTAPKFYLDSNGFKSNDEYIFPLGGISNSTHIFEKESGYYPIIQLDEYGFNNPNGLFKDKIDLMMIGDSFTEGQSVKPKENIAAGLRKFNINVINLGKGGNGPLSEFATLIEYAKPFKPDIVLWNYFSNDLDDLINELNNPILKKYLDNKNFSQNLINKQNEIDKVLKNFAKEALIKEKRKEINNVVSIIKLSKIRMLINLTPSHEAVDTINLKSNFIKILLEAKNNILEWGGNMYFVYLPPFETYSTGVNNKYRDFILSTIKDLNIPIIDVHADLFKKHPNPKSFFPFNRNGHYNAAGYSEISDFIGKRLVKDKVIN